MKRVLFDTNVILDFLLEREPFFNEASALFQGILSGQVQGYVTATTLTDIFYISRKSKGVDLAKQDVSTILTIMKICSVNRRILQAALLSNLKDFEDGVQLICANRLNLEAIITRDRQDFAGANLPILSPSEFLQLLAEENKNKGDN